MLPRLTYIPSRFVTKVISGHGGIDFVTFGV
jgi:hypothetical protein